MVDSGGQLRILTAGGAIDFGSVSDITDKFNVTPTAMKFPTVPMDNQFCMDMGCSDSVTFSFVRQHPPDWTAPDNNSPDSTLWSNAFWYLKVIALMDRWQFETDGVSLIYNPADGDVQLQLPYLSKRGYIKSIETDYKAGDNTVISGTVSIQIGTAYMTATRETPSRFYGITYVNNGAGAYVQRSLQFGYMSGSSVTLFNPPTDPKSGNSLYGDWLTANPGYTLTGWTTTPNGAKVYNLGQVITMPNDNLVLYGFWEQQAPSTYAVTYRANTSTCPNTVQTVNVTAGANHTIIGLPSGWQTCGGDAMFMGWSGNAGGPVQYQPGNVITVTQPRTIYAIWAQAVIQIYTSGSGTYTVPSGITRINVYIVGGGGGGGVGKTGTPNGGSGGGGGGSGYYTNTGIINVSAGNTFSYAVGAGGYMNNGGTTTFGSYSATGGHYGGDAVYNPATGGTGGTGYSVGGNGSAPTSGSSGANGQAGAGAGAGAGGNGYNGSPWSAGGGGGGGGPYRIGSLNGIGGKGGDGFGASPGPSGANGTYGGGGGGGGGYASTDSASTGAGPGFGGDGYIYIMQY